MNWKQASLLACVALLVSAGSAASYFTSPEREREDGRLRAVATFYPLYYFAQQIGGERARVDSLIPFNSEPHSWEPRISDIVSVDRARVFIHNGAGLEPWVGSILSVLQNRDRMQVVDATRGLPLESGHHGEEGGQESGDHDHGGLNPHAWIDPLLASMQVDNILGGFRKADPVNAAYYEANAQDLKARLEALHHEFENGLTNRTKNVIVTTHEGFDYLAERYNFTARAVLGLEPNGQPSAARIADIVSVVEEHDLNVVFGEPVYSDAYMRTISQEVQRRSGRGVKVLVLDGIHGRAGPHADLDYFGIQRANLEALRMGLGVA